MIEFEFGMGCTHMVLTQQPEKQIIFDGHDIVVSAVLGFDNPDLVISFSSRNNSGLHVDTPALEVNNEGESFFYKRQIPAIYFFARDNHWWQSEEVFEAIRLLNAMCIREKYTTITTYGLSMGGYGALMFSNLLQADRVIAIAPQYSIDSRVVPFETRWLEDRQRVSFIYDDMSKGLIKNGQVIIFYDKFFDFDKRHVDLIKSHREVDHFLVNFSTHTVARALNDMGIFSRIMETVFRGQMNKTEFYQLIKQDRRKSPLLLHNMAVQIRKKGHKATASKLFVIAMDLLEKRTEDTPEFYKNFVNTMISIRVVENYLKDKISHGLITSEEFYRCKHIVEEFFTLVPSYKANWQLALAQGEFAIGNLAMAKDILNNLLGNVVKNQIRPYLNLYIQILHASGDILQLDHLLTHYQKEIMENDGIRIRLAKVYIQLKQYSQASQLLDYNPAELQRIQSIPSIYLQKQKATAALTKATKTTLVCQT